MSDSPPAATALRMGIALRAVFQSEAWLGAHAGAFSRLGIDLTFPAIATGGPAAMAGATRGDWDVCHTGALPIMQGVLRGEDPVLLITPTELHEAVFVMARREFTTLAHLAGQRIGAVDAAGQFGRPLKILLEQSRIDAEMLSLGSFQAIDAALTKGEIAAGYLPIDLRFRGESEHGWNALTGLPIVGGIATTRRFIAANRPLVGGFVKGRGRRHPSVQDPARHRHPLAAAISRDRRARADGKAARLLRTPVPRRADADVLCRNGWPARGAGRAISGGAGVADGGCRGCVVCRGAGGEWIH